MTPQHSFNGMNVEACLVVIFLRDFMLLKLLLSCLKLLDVETDVFL